ncbi:hypothetical protein AB0J52_32745 [Spirillospora sp. NPDC049652]
MIILSGVLVVVAIALLVAGIVAGNGDSAQVFGVDAIVVIYSSIAISLVAALFLLLGVFLRRKEIFGTGPAASPRRDRKAAKGKGKKNKAAGQATVPGAASQAGDGDPDDAVVIPLQPMDVPDDAIVHVVRGRKRYHLDTCRQLAGRETEELTYAEAREEGFSPCTACLPDTALAARAAISVGAPSAGAGSAAGESGAKKGDAPSGAPSGPAASAASPSAPPAAAAPSAPSKSGSPSAPTVPSAWPTPAAPPSASTPPAPSGRGDVTLPDLPVTGAPPASPTLTDIPVPVSKPEAEPEPKAERKAASTTEPETAPERDRADEKPSDADSADTVLDAEEKAVPATPSAEKATAAPVEEPAAEDEPAKAKSAETEPVESVEPEKGEAEKGGEPAAVSAAPPRPRESSDEDEQAEEPADKQAEAAEKKAEAEAADETETEGAGTPASADEDEQDERAERAEDAEGERAAAEEEPQVRILSGTKRYHRPDCALIEDIGDDAEDLESLPRSEAKERGCTPCLVCQPDREHARD